MNPGRPGPCCRYQCRPSRYDYLARCCRLSPSRTPGSSRALLPLLQLLSEMFFDHKICPGPSLVCSSDLSRFYPFLDSVCIIALSHVDSESHLLNQYPMCYRGSFHRLPSLPTTVARLLLILIAISILRLFLIIILQKQDISSALFSNLLDLRK